MKDWNQAKDGDGAEDPRSAQLDFVGVSVFMSAVYECFKSGGPWAGKKQNGATYVMPD